MNKQPCYSTFSALLALSFLLAPPALGASQVSRISLAQAANGYTVKATYNMDVVIRFDGREKIAYVWGSNNLLFNPRFVQGGKLLVLQSTARPQNMQTLPELGRPAGTLAVVLESGESVVFNLIYTPEAQNQIVEIFRGGRAGDTPVPLMQAALQANNMAEGSQMRISRQGMRVTQDGFVSPLIQAEAIQSENSSRRSSVSPKTGYWILEQAMAEPNIWQQGSDASAYKALFQTLQQGKADGADFEPTLALAQRLSGVSDGNLIWLVRRLAESPTKHLAPAKTDESLPAFTVPSLPPLSQIAPQRTDLAAAVAAPQPPTSNPEHSTVLLPAPVPLESGTVVLRSAPFPVSNVPGEEKR
jgi:hypothetical protein